MPSAIYYGKRALVPGPLPHTSNFSPLEVAAGTLPAWCPQKVLDQPGYLPCLKKGREGAGWREGGGSFDPIFCG